MKTIISLVVVIAFSCSAIAVAVENSEPSYKSVLTKSVKVQDDAVPPVPVPDSVPAGVPVESGTVMEGPAVGQPMMVAPMAGGCCNPCATPCCPPPPQSMIFCLKDPCGCMHEAKVCVPGCCVGEQPCITWRNGIFGRQIATLCWKCCDHQVRVIICRNGRVKVRG